MQTAMNPCVYWLSELLVGVANEIDSRRPMLCRHAYSHNESVVALWLLCFFWSDWVKKIKICTKSFANRSQELELVIGVLLLFCYQIMKGGINGK